MCITCRVSVCVICARSNSVNEVKFFFYQLVLLSHLKSKCMLFTVSFTGIP